MHRRRLNVSLSASLAIVALAGCGAPPTQLARPASGASSSMGARSLVKPPAVRPLATTAMPQANPDGQDIAKNPFVIWIKQNYSQAAATIINQYLASDGPADSAPNAEGNRVLLRRQALDAVANELVKNLKQGLPKGLVAKVAEPGHVRVSGYQRQLGFKIDLRFDFTLQMDEAGMIWIKVPAALLKASADSAIVRMFGGDLNEKAYTELLKELGKQGSPNAKQTPRLTYTKGGTFRVAPGFAFVNMPS